MQRRSFWLPPRKVEAYSNAIDEVVQAADAHPSSLVPKDQMITVLGKISSAAGPIPTIWRHFGGIISIVAAQQFEMYVQSNPKLVKLLNGVKEEMQQQQGQPFTVYRLRPGTDGLRVWQSFTGRRTRTGFTVEEVRVMFTSALRWLDEEDNPDERRLYINLIAACGLMYEKGYRGGNVIRARWNKVRDLDEGAHTRTDQLAKE
eukprot:COSAG03_NODE_1909_length_3367_cov_9.998164_4_plen_203_part_00